LPRIAKRFAALGFAVVAMLGLAIAGCSSDVSESDIDQANARIDDVEEQTTKSQLLAFTNAVRAEDLHGLDEDINAATEIDTSWIGRATRARRATASVTWPSDMKDAADALLDSLTTLESKLAAEDLAGAKGPATDSHENYHELDHMVAPFLAGETPAPEEDEGHTATATATAAAH
jgi:hypothetical protein